MAKIQDLNEKKLQAVSALREMVDSADKAGKDVDAAKFEEVSADIERYDAEIQRIAKLEKFEQALNAPIGTRVDVGTKVDNAEKEKKAFFDYVRSGDKSAYFAVTNLISSGGNVAVPQPVAVKVFERLQNMTAVLKYADVLRTTSTTLLGLGGAATAGWGAELAAYTDSSPAVPSEALGAHKLNGVVFISEELIQDQVFDVENWVVNELSRVFAETADAAFLRGDGSGKPAGILTKATYAGQNFISTTSAATAIDADDLIDVLYAMPAAYRAGTNTRWVFGSDTLKVIRKLKDENKQYIWQPSAIAGQPDALLGKPVAETDYAGTYTLGASVGGLVNFDNIVVGIRGNMEFQRLNEVRALNGQIGIKAFMRTDIGLKNIGAVSRLVRKA